jgi:hypothetical protein
VSAREVLDTADGASEATIVSCLSLYVRACIEAGRLLHAQNAVELVKRHGLADRFALLMGLLDACVVRQKKVVWTEK